MAQVKNFDDRIAEIDQFAAMVATVKSRLLEAQAYERQELENGILVPNDLSVRIDGILSGLTAYTGTDMKAAIDLFTTEIEIWAARVSKDMFHDTNAWDSVKVEVAPNGTDAILTVNQAGVAVSIFTTLFIPLDVIEITNAEDPKHNGFHTIKSAGVGAQALTLDSNMLGEDNANDKSMIITLVER